MKLPKRHIFLFMTLFSVMLLNAQDEDKKIKKESDRFIAEAQELLSDNDFANAEAAYRKAIARDPSNTKAKYNMGNLYHVKEKSLNAESRLKQAAEIAATKEEKHRIYHNLGNNFMKQKKYQEAVDAFKDALRNNPNDEETRYNLALAKQKRDEEKPKSGQDKNKDQNKDEQKKEDQQDKKDQGGGGDDENKDQKPKDEGDQKEEDKKDGDQKEDKQKDQNEGDKEEQKKGDQQQQQQQRPAQGQLSQQQIQSLLEAMNNEEKKVQDKINAKKAKGVKVKAEKDW